MNNEQYGGGWDGKVEEPKTFSGRWDALFKKAERDLKEFPMIGVIVSNIKPPVETARNIYKEDNEEIEAAAKANGFRCVARGKQIHFIKHNDK